MFSYMVRRLLYAVPVLIAVSIIAFALVHLSGDPVSMMVPTHASQETIDQIRQQMGLDQPVYVQYALFVRDALRGDLGRSIKFGQPAGPLLVRRLPATFQLVVLGLGGAAILAIPAGVVCATRPYSPIDNAATVFAMVLVSIPTFWLGIMLILIFAEILGLLPSSGSGSWRHAIMPATVIGANTLGLLIRLIRTNMGDVLSMPYIATARSKGLGESTVLFRHALKNALGLTVTILGLRFGATLGGAVIIETVFAWPGFGWLIIQGVYARDLALVRAGVLIIGVVFVLINLLVDITHTILDPRIVYS